MNRISLVIFASAFAVSPLSANDTVAEIGAGGLEYVRSDQIEMVREDLYISMKEIRVDYVFRNHGEASITTMVAFPMPDVTSEFFGEVAIPFYDDDNFLGFSVKVDGEPIMPSLQQRAKVIGVDVTRELVKRRIPLFPFGTAVLDALDALSVESLASLERKGLIQIEVYDVGNGMEEHPFPLWTLQSAYYWEMEFPAGRDLQVSHVYTPAKGATTGLSESFLGDGAISISEDYATRYCVDEGFVRAAKNRTQGNVLMFENWVSYILTTGQNWYRNIGLFHLTIDKGATDNLVSFCGEGVTKTGPTTFELTYENYYPERDLDILFLQNMGN